jgi:hypothetical protein
VDSSDELKVYEGIGVLGYLWLGGGGQGHVLQAPAQILWLL